MLGDGELGGTRTNLLTSELPLHDIGNTTEQYLKYHYMS